MSKPQVAIVILNWNGFQDTQECLKSIDKSDQSNIKLVVYVVDNASADNSVVSISKQFPQHHLLVSHKNLGYSGGNNLGINQAFKDGADWVVLLNNDTIVDKHTFDRLISEADTHKFDLVSPKIYFYPGKEFHRHDYQKNERGKVIWYAGGRNDWANVWAQHIGVDEVDHGQFDLITSTDFASGCCLAIRRQVISRIGNLDTGFTAYFEDNDYCQRAQKQGFKVGYIPSTHLWHKNAGSTGGSGSATQKKLIDQSRLRFALKHAPFRAKLALIKFNLLSNINKH